MAKIFACRQHAGDTPAQIIRFVTVHQFIDRSGIQRSIVSFSSGLDQMPVKLFVHAIR